MRSAFKSRLPGLCRKGFFDCGFGICIPQSKIHDGVPDCLDLSDECKEIIMYYFDSFVLCILMLYICFFFQQEKAKQQLVNTNQLLLVLIS